MMRLPVSAAKGAVTRVAKRQRKRALTAALVLGFGYAAICGATCILTGVAQAAPPQDEPQVSALAESASSQTTSTAKSTEIVVPAGTSVSLALTNPILANAATPGDSVYAQTAFPVTVKNQIAIPPGTYVQGEIDSVTRPGWLSPHAQFQIHFTKIIYASGYTVELGGTRNVTIAAPNVARNARPAANHDVIAAVAVPYVQVSSSNDVLLDDGSQIEMVLQVPVRLNAASVTAAVRQSGDVQLPQFRSATLCRPVPGTPGTSDTVIPGTPGTPGTPDTVIPGGPGMPDTVIPGIPATPGTPDTVIPGSPGSPGIACPGPPVVIPNPKTQTYKESFELSATAQVSGTQLAAGGYQVTWEGPSAPAQSASPGMAQVNILQNGKAVASVRARVVLLSAKAAANAPGTRAKSDGTTTLQSLRFAGQSFALYF